MEDQEFWGTMLKIIREELAAAIKDYLPQLPALEGERMVSTSELCGELKMSKQTLYNWLKKPLLKMLIEKHRQRRGGKMLYNITGIKVLIKDHALLFGNGKDYGYKFESPSQQRLLPRLVFWRGTLRTTE